MTQVIYSTEPVDQKLMEGRTVKNPRYFLEPVDGATKVFIERDRFKDVVRAYEKIKVPVAELDEAKALPGTVKPAGENK